jgi:hypothetical protein
VTVIPDIAQAEGGGAASYWATSEAGRSDREKRPPMMLDLRMLDLRARALDEHARMRTGKPGSFMNSFRRKEGSAKGTSATRDFGDKRL